MLKNFSYTQKNKLLFPAVGIGVLLCWFFALGKTFESIHLNQRLNKDSETSAKDLSFNPLHTERKLKALDAILKGYRVRESQWRNDLWFKASSIAVKQNVSIDYTLNTPVLERDSTAVGLDQSLYFYGGYTPLVKLIDSLEKIKGIGKIFSVEIKAPFKDLVNEKKDKAVLKIDFKGIN